MHEKEQLELKLKPDMAHDATSSKQQQAKSARKDHEKGEMEREREKKEREKKERAMIAEVENLRGQGGFSQGLGIVH